jgi:hypothetical protein
VLVFYMTDIRLNLLDIHRRNSQLPPSHPPTVRRPPTCHISPPSRPASLPLSKRPRRASVCKHAPPTSSRRSPSSALCPPCLSGPIKGAVATTSISTSICKHAPLPPPPSLRAPTPPRQRLARSSRQVEWTHGPHHRAQKFLPTCPCSTSLCSAPNHGYLQNVCTDLCYSCCQRSLMPCHGCGDGRQPSSCWMLH